MNDSPWIRTDGVGFFHGRQRVLDGVRLDLRRGRHYIVTGPNGAGKTTLLDILAGLKTPASGSVAVMEKPLAARTARERARLLSFAPQDSALDFAFTVREAVAMGRRPYLGRWGVLEQADRDAVERALRRLHLENLADKFVTALSGGERRRCVVARAVAQETPVLLLDEPTAGLDVAQALSLMHLAKSLAEEQGRLVVTVTHDLNLASVYGHELIFLKNGGIEASGPVAEVFREDVLSRVYDADARIRHDDFAGGPAVSFRLKNNGHP